MNRVLRVARLPGKHLRSHGRFDDATSFSTMFSKARVFSCVILEGSDETVAMGDFCPGHVGAIGPENMILSHVILDNDPYRGGCHTPEFMTESRAISIGPSWHMR